MAPQLIIKAEVLAFRNVICVYTHYVVNYIATYICYLRKNISISGLDLAVIVENAVGCNCWHCEDEKVIGLCEETTTKAAMYEEDTDDDGDRTICARNRDFNDRTFPSVCHMLCYNRCTKYRLVTVKENDVVKYVIVAYRPNYYKLRNGKC